MSSTKKLATSAVTAGIRKIDPTTMPSPAAIDRIQARMVSGMCALAPSMLSAQTSPAPASQTSRRCRLKPITKISTSASPTDFSRIARNGGDSIWENDLTAASSITVLRATSAEVTMTAGRHKPARPAKRLAERI